MKIKWFVAWFVKVTPFFLCVDSVAINCSLFVSIIYKFHIFHNPDDREISNSNVLSDAACLS